MRNPVLVPALVVCTLLAGCAEKRADHDRAEAVKGLARSIVAERGVPGIAIAVIRDGKLFGKFAHGYSDLAAHRPVSSKTPFQLASTTKIFSSSGVLLLVADGKVRLDSPIGDYLDGLPPAWRAITVRQLLSYTSGLPDVTSNTGEVDLIAQTWDDALPMIANRPFQFQPGTSWAYTQTNYALLLRLIERVSGKTFEQFLDERMFRPLGMRDTFYPGPKRSCAVSYERWRGGKIEVRSQLQFPHYVHAAGGLCSSLDDMIAWDAALDSGKIIPLKLEQDAWTPTKLKDGSIARVGGPIGYGLGWAIDTTPGHRWVGHSGGNSTAFRRYLDDRMTVIVLHNGTSDPDAIAGAVARSMLQEAGTNPQADLWDSAGSGDLAAVEAALQSGAKVNALDTRSSRNGRYALNWAAINDHADVIRFLLAHGAPIDARNLTGFTALHHAAESGSADAAAALLDGGADTSIRSEQGETAAEVARRHGNSAVADLIAARASKK